MGTVGCGRHAGRRAPRAHADGASENVAAAECTRKLHCEATVILRGVAGPVRRSASAPLSRYSVSLPRTSTASVQRAAAPLRVALVNRFFPPDPSVTGEAAAELADYLAAHMPSLAIHVFSTRARYSHGTPLRAELNAHRVTRVASFYDGRNKLLRLAASLLDGWRLARAAVRDADIVISLTDPPLLGLWMARATRRRQLRWIEWTMDLYPEAFVAAGLLSRTGVVARFLARLARRATPEAYICLGPVQHRFLEAQRGARAAAFVLPCGIATSDPRAEPAWRTDHPGHVLIAYAGNIGEAHSPDALVRLVELADPARFRFILAPSGRHAADVRRRLAGQPHVVWQDRVNREDLAHADVHAVSLLSDWSSICVPSKAVSAVCAGRPIIFFGSTDTDTWQTLGDAAWIVREVSGVATDEDIRATLAGVADDRQRADRQRAATRLSGELTAVRDSAFAEIAAWIEAAGVPSRPVVATR